MQCPRLFTLQHASVDVQISQFTLLAKMKGNKPSYHLAMPPNEVTL